MWFTVLNLSKVNEESSFLYRLFYIQVLLLLISGILEINLVKKTNLLDKTKVILKRRHGFLKFWSVCYMDQCFYLDWTEIIYKFFNLIFLYEIQKKWVSCFCFKYLFKEYFAFGIFKTRLEAILTKTLLKVFAIDFLFLIVIPFNVNELDEVLVFAPLKYCQVFSLKSDSHFLK